MWPKKVRTIYIIVILINNSEIIKLLLINNDFIKKILNIIINNDNNDKLNYILPLLREKIELILNDINNINFKYDYNYFFESYNEINKLYFELNEFNLNQRINDINNLFSISKNNTIKYPYLNGFELNKNYNNINSYNFPMNNIIYKEKENIFDNKKSDNNEDITQIDICKKNYDYFIVPYSMNRNEIKENILNNGYSQELKENILNNGYSQELKENILNNGYSQELKENKNLNFNKKLNNNTSLNKKKIIFKTRRKASKYRGVTKNRKKWQAYIWINKKNTYLGSYKCEKIAALIYDFMAIKKNGIRAKTNFAYNMRQIVKIYNIDINLNNIDIDIDNIYNIISQK